MIRPGIGRRAWLALAAAAVAITCGAAGARAEEAGTCHRLSGPASRGPVPTRETGPSDLFQGGAITIQHENDAFVPKGVLGIIGTDRYYTAGQRVVWVSRSDCAHWFLRPVKLFSTTGDNTQQRWGLELGQNIFTPENIHTAAPDPRDRPYAAWLYLGAMVISQTPTERNTVEVLVGVVGPSALGEEAQNGIHRIRNIAQAQGWAHQLKDEPALLITREDRLQPREIALFGGPRGLAIDFTPIANLQFGNVQTSASVGGGLRLGVDLPDDFGPPRMRPGPSGGSYFDGKRAGWYAFFNADARVVAHDIFLDGNTFRSSPSVRKVPFGWEVEAGLVGHALGARITYAMVRRSREFHGQKTADEFASISLTFIPASFPKMIR